MTIKLVTRPTATEEVKASVVRILRETLEQAERGEIDCVVVIFGNPDGEWQDRASETVRFSEAIGRLEITKAEWIAKYLQHV